MKEPTITIFADPLTVVRGLSFILLTFVSIYLTLIPVNRIFTPVSIFVMLYKQRGVFLVEFTKVQVDEILARVVEELKEQRIPRQKFYEESGINSSSFSQWNTGLRKPSMLSVQKMANYLDVPVDYLLTGDKTFYPNNDTEEVMELKQMLVDRPEAKILFQASKNAPTSAILEAAALLMRYKEESEKN